MKRSWITLAAGLALVLATGGTATATVTASTSRAVTAAELRPAGDKPPGFWWGTDSWPVSIPGSAPYSEPRIGGSYGGYIGMTGSWSVYLSCKGGFLAYSPANAAQAHTNYVTYHKGIGVASYWFMGGPGVDPHYNGTSAEASGWGARQAAATLSDIAKQHVNTYPVIWADIELPGVAPASDNGWNSVYTAPCSGVVKQSYVPATLDRADFNGFASYITAHSPTRWACTPRPGSGPRSSAPGARPRSLTPTNGRTSRRPPTSPTPLSAGACPPAGARSSSAARATPAATR